MTANVAAMTILELPERKTASWAGLARGGENLVVSFSLAAMVVLPLAEIVLRKVFHTGISGSTAFVQHFCLIVGMLGGAVAAREKRLLSLSTLGGLLKGRAKTIATILAGSVAAAITAFLAIASVQFVLAEKEAAEVLAYEIPTWVVQLALPIGFGLVALRIVWRHRSACRTRRARVRADRNFA
jgi:C4-dicarboxylate transporter DctM subunit